MYVCVSLQSGAYQVAHNQILAHVRAVDLYRNKYKVSGLEIGRSCMQHQVNSSLSAIERSTRCLVLCFACHLMEWIWSLASVPGLGSESTGPRHPVELKAVKPRTCPVLYTEPCHIQRPASLLLFQEQGRVIGITLNSDFKQPASHS
jgi:hypothetical protein